MPDLRVLFLCGGSYIHRKAEAAQQAAIQAIDTEAATSEAAMLEAGAAELSTWELKYAWGLSSPSWLQLFSTCCSAHLGSATPAPPFSSVDVIVSQSQSLLRAPPTHRSFTHGPSSPLRYGAGNAARAEINAAGEAAFVSADGSVPCVAFSFSFSFLFFFRTAQPSCVPSLGTALEPCFVYWRCLIN